MTSREPNLSEDRITSLWPLSTKGIRQVIPQAIISRLQQHPLSEDLVPLAMGYYPKASMHNMQRDNHDTYLLIYCISGEGSLMINGRKSAIRSGDAALLPPGMHHHYWANEDTPWTIFWVHFIGSRAGDYSSFTGIGPPTSQVGLKAELIAGFERLLIQQQAFLFNHYVQKSNLLKGLLTEIGNINAAQQRALNPHFGMEAIIQHMQHHLQNELDLEDLASLANLSKFHFIRRFKDMTGQTPIQYFIHLKMERACEQLDDSETAIKTIAANLGYSDPLYFSRQFKKVFGISPQQYRRLRAT